MQSFIVTLHSLNRFILLALLLVVIVRTFLGWQKKSAYTSTDNKLSLFLFISTHTQLLLGLILYFISEKVSFSSMAMKIPGIRYYTVEHITGMLLAIILISVARISAKKLSSGTAKHQRMFIFNAAALVIIVAMIIQSHRGFFEISW